MYSSKIMDIVEYLAMASIAGIIIILVLEIDFPPINSDTMGWTPLYLPFCYAIEPIYGLYSSYLIAVPPLLVITALHKQNIHCKFFLQAVFRLEICKYIFVIIVRLWWGILGVKFELAEPAWIIFFIVFIFILRKSLKVVSNGCCLDRYDARKGFWSTIVVLIFTFTPYIQYDEGITAANRDICIPLNLEESGIILDQPFRVTRCVERFGFVLDAKKLDIVDHARFRKKVVGLSDSKNVPFPIEGCDLSLTITIYEIGGVEKEIYKKKIEKIKEHSNSNISRYGDMRYYYDVSVDKLNLKPGEYRLAMKSESYSHDLEGINVFLYIKEQKIMWKFYR